MKKTVEKVKNYINHHNLFPAPGGIVVGLSGGADSVALLLLLRSLYGDDGAYPLFAVHVHHGIRGAEADADAEFVRALCERLGVPLVIRYVNAPAYAREKGLSEEEAGRELRYGVFEEVRAERNALYIAVAHNQNDVCETVLFHMSRGSNLRGLTGIPARRDSVNRPLLCLTRQEIESYLSACGESYCTDSTNADTAYDRNRIRHTVLPELAEVNSAAVTHIAELAENLREIDLFLDVLAGERAREACTYINDEKEKGVMLDIPGLMSLPRVLRSRVIYEAIAQVCGAKKDITARHVEACLKLCEGETGKEVCLPYALTAQRRYDRLYIFREEDMEKSKSFHISLTLPGEYELPNGYVLTLAFTDKKTDGFEKNIYTKFFDYDKMKSTLSAPVEGQETVPLCVRNPEAEDFLIFSTGGERKKLSRIFIDAKIDRDKRAGWPVVACGSEILWAVGLRGSEAYRITDDTKQILTMEYRKTGGQ